MAAARNEGRGAQIQDQKRGLGPRGIEYMRPARTYLPRAPPANKRWGCSTSGNFPTDFSPREGLAPVARGWEHLHTSKVRVTRVCQRSLLICHLFLLTNVELLESASVASCFDVHCSTTIMLESRASTTEPPDVVCSCDQSHVRVVRVC